MRDARRLPPQLAIIVWPRSRPVVSCENGFACGRWEMVTTRKFSPFVYLKTDTLLFGVNVWSGTRRQSKERTIKELRAINLRNVRLRVAWSKLFTKQSYRFKSPDSQTCFQTRSWSVDRGGASNLNGDAGIKSGRIKQIVSKRPDVGSRKDLASASEGRAA